VVEASWLKGKGENGRVLDFDWCLAAVAAVLELGESDVLGRGGRALSKLVRYRAMQMLVERTAV